MTARSAAGRCSATGGTPPRCRLRYPTNGCRSGSARSRWQPARGVCKNQAQDGERAPANARVGNPEHCAHRCCAGLPYFGGTAVRRFLQRSTVSTSASCASTNRLSGTSCSPCIPRLMALLPRILYLSKNVRKTRLKDQLV